MNRYRFRLFIPVVTLALSACGGVDKREAAEKIFRQGDDWYRSTKYNEAGMCYTRALQLLDHDYPEAAVGLGNVRREQCRMESRRFIDNDPANGINTSEVKKLYDDAEFYFRMADRMKPNYRDALYSLGLLYFEMATNKLVVRGVGAEQQLRWLEAARERFESALRLNPAMGSSHEYLAQIYNLEGIDHEAHNRTLDAIASFEKSQQACDRFLAWFWRQPLKTQLPEEFDKRRDEFEKLKMELEEVLQKLRAEVGLAGTKTNEGTK